MLAWTSQADSTKLVYVDCGLPPVEPWALNPTESAQDLTRRAKHCPISSTYMKQNRSIWHNSPLQIGSIQPKLAVFCLVEASTNVKVVVIYLAKKEEEPQPSSFAKICTRLPPSVKQTLGKESKGQKYCLFVSLPSAWVDPGKSCEYFHYHTHYY